MYDFEERPLDDDFIDEEYDDGEGNDFEDFEDNLVNEESDEEAEEDGDFGESSVTETMIGYCRICGAEVIIDELPDSISKDAFQDFGLCLNCQWGIYMENGGHF